MGKMKFEKFANTIVEKIGEYLPENLAYEKRELQTVTKNNDNERTGLKIKVANSDVSIMIYLEEFYEMYQNGWKLSSVLKKIADLRLSYEKNCPSNLSQIRDEERARAHVIPLLVRKAWNEQALSGMPYKSIADLAVTYHILIEEDNGIGKVAVTMEMMEKWGMTIEELHSLALKNMATLLPGKIVPVHDVICNITGENVPDDMFPVEEEMYILSNRIGINGASALLDERIVDDIIDRIGDGFYVIPSSVHEVICVKNSEYADPVLLSAMLQETNQSQLPREDWLSDQVYSYTRAEGLQPIITYRLTVPNKYLRVE